jgi:uncharacterized protein YdaU (DUF1376 family)
VANKAPAYQWYPKDFKTDEKCQLMNYEQQGVYRALLDHQWLHGSIPIDPEDIAELLKIPYKDFQKIWRRVGVCFEEINGRLVNERMEKEREKLDSFKAERSESGSKGAQKRWQNDNSANGSGNGSAIEQPMANDSSASAIAFPDSNTSTQKNPSKHVTDDPSPSLWDEFCRIYPKRSGALNRAKAEPKFKKLGKEQQAAIDGLKKYRAWCDATGKTGTELVKQMDSWINGRLWLEDYEIPPMVHGRVVSRIGPEPDQTQPIEGKDYVLKDNGKGLVHMDANDPARGFDAQAWFRQRNLNPVGKWRQAV